MKAFLDAAAAAFLPQDCLLCAAPAVRAVRVVTTLEPRWEPPEEYLNMAVSDTVCRLILSYNHAGIRG